MVGERQKGHSHLDLDLDLASPPGSVQQHAAGARASESLSTVDQRVIGGLPDHGGNQGRSRTHAGTGTRTTATLRKRKEGCKTGSGRST
eukprot:911880-Prorocentrum_minimum.AAC.1